MIGRRRLQADDPPPDLAIATDFTSKTTLDAYTAIGVPEVWVYDSGKLTIYVLSEGKYLKFDVSLIFPNLPIGQTVPTIVERAWQVGTVEALEELEALIK